MSFALVAVAFAVGTMFASKLAGWFFNTRRAKALGRHTRTKDTPYECGMNAVGEGSSRMSVKFYLIAMLFILFDIEVVFLYPWAVVYKDMLGDETTVNLIFGTMISFLASFSSAIFMPSARMPSTGKLIPRLGGCQHSTPF